MLPVECKGMNFPVDLLADVSHVELEQLAHNYLKNLLYSNPDFPERLVLSDSTQVTIDISSVGFVPLYGLRDNQKILALFSPSDPLTAVALYLLDQWWTVDDILKTADPTRDGAMEVETVGERIVLYILNRVIYRAKEMSSVELPFLCHGEKDHAKILWNKGEAVGFYSVKPSGSLCSSFSTRTYLLPVMDSIFVRKCQRGQGFGLQMLEDFVLSFKEDSLGLKYPLTKSMYKVCERYLYQYPGHTDLLWEVESIGGPNQRTNIGSKIQVMDLTVSKSLSCSEEPPVISEVTEKDVVIGAITTHLKVAESMESKVEIVEEVTVEGATKVSEAKLPVASRGWSSVSKRTNMGEKITEDTSEKVIRVEDIEAETPGEEQVSGQKKTDLHNVSELLQTEAMFIVAPKEKGEGVDTEPKEAAAIMSDKPATVLASQDVEEADVSSAPMAVELQLEDGVKRDLNNFSHDSHVTVENVASEIEETKSQKEDTTILVIPEEVLDVHKEAETLNKVGEGTQIEVTEEKSEDRVMQHIESLSTQATSEGGEAKKTGKTVVKAIKTVQSETPRRRSERHRKLEEGVKKETTAQDRGIVLRGRTLMSTPTLKCKSKQYSKKISEELEKEVDKVAEENDISTTEVVQKLTEREKPEEITSVKEDVVALEELREETSQLVDEQLTNEEETKKEEEPGVGDTVVKGSSSEIPDTAETALTEENVGEKVTDELEKELNRDEVETSMIQDKQEEVRTDEDELGAGGSLITEKADEKATDKQMGENRQVEQEETVDNPEEEIPTEEFPVVDKGTIPMAEEAAEDVIPLIEVNIEEREEFQEDEETERGTETLSVIEVDKEGDADEMIPEPDTVAAASETVTPDKIDEAAVLVAEEPQEKATGSEIPKLQKATVILVNLKTTCHHVSVEEAEETPVDGQCAAPEKEQIELIAAEEKEVCRCVADEQTPQPEKLVEEEEDEGKQKSVTATAEAETVEREEPEEDNSDREKEESADMDGGKSEVEEDNIGEVITEKEVEEAESGTFEVEGGERKVMTKDADTVTVQLGEKQVAVSNICADREADVVDVAEENLPPTEVNEAMSLEEEKALIEPRALRSGTKTATPRHKTTRSRKQVDEKESENTEEEPAVTMRTLRRGRTSASATPKGRVEESKSVEDTRVEEEEAVKEDTVEEEKLEEEIGAASEREGSLKPEIDVEEGEAVTEEGQYVVKEQSEAISKTFAETEVNASGEECDEWKPVMTGEEEKQQDEEMEEGRASVEKSADEDEPPEEPRILRRGRKSVRKQLQKEEEGPKESAEKAEVEEEAGLRSANEPPTEGDEGEAPEEDTLVPVEVEKGLSEEETMTMTEEKEKTAGVTATADDLGQDGETVTPLPKLATNSAILTPSGEDVTPSAEDRHIEEMVPQLSDLQRVTVVLVDLKKTHYEVQEERATVEEGVPVEKTAVEEKEEQREGTTQEDGTMAEENVPGSPVGIENTELEKVVVEEEGLRANVKDPVTIQDTGEGRAEETAKEDEAKSVDDNEDDDDEEEPTVAETRARKSRKQVVKSTPRRRLARRRKKKSEEENEETSEIEEEEPEVQVRVLRGGRKYIHVTPRCKRKRTHKQLLEEEEVEEESTAAEEGGAEEEEEQAGEQQQMIDQEKGERLEVKDATQQVENIEPEMGVEEVDTVAEDAVILSEEGQAGSNEAVSDEGAEALVGQSADEGNTSDDVAEEAVTTQDTAKDDETKGVSEEERAPVIETRFLRSGEKTVRGKTTNRDEQDKEATGEKSREGDEPAVEPRVLRKGRRSAAAATPRHKAKRARTQCETEEEGENKSSPAEEMQVEETKADANENNSDEKMEDKDGEEPVAQKGGNPEPEVEIKKVEAVADESLTEQETVEEEQSAASETSGQEETPNTDEGKAPQAPVVQTRVLRSGGKAVKATSRSKTTKSQQEKNEQEGAVVEKSADTDELAVETAATHKSRACTPCQPEEEGEEKTTPAEETEGEEEEARQELPGEKGEKAQEEEEHSMEMGAKKDKDVEGEEVERVAGEESAVGDVEQNDASTEGEAILEKEDNSMAAEDVTRTDIAKVEETNSAEKEETTVTEKSAATEEGSHIAIAEGEAPVADESVVTEEEAPAVGARTLRSKTKTLNATPSRSSRRRKGQGVVKTQQQDQNPEDKETQEVHQLTDDSPENRELNAKKQAETDEASPTRQEEGHQAEDNAEDQAKEIADLRDNRLIESAGEEPATEEMELPEEEASESKGDKTVESSVVEGRSLRGRMKTVAVKEEGKAEEIQLSKRKSVRKRPRVDYKENDEEDEGGEAEAATSEKGGVVNLVVDTDEEEETAGLSQEDKEDEQNMSEEEVEPIVVTNDLIINTPQSKSRRRRAKVKKSEESLSDEEKSPQSAQRRSPRKRKSSAVTPTRKSKRFNRV